MIRQRYETPKITVDLFEETDVIYASDMDDNLDDLDDLDGEDGEG